MIKPGKQTEDFFSKPKNCETLIKQTHTKPQETLKFNLTKPRETFSFKPPISIEASSMIGIITSPEAYNSFFIITGNKGKLELQTVCFDESSIAEIKDEFEEILGFPNNLHELLQGKIIGPRIITPNK